MTKKVRDAFKNENGKYLRKNGEDLIDKYYKAEGGATHSVSPPAVNANLGRSIHPLWRRSTFRRTSILPAFNLDPIPAYSTRVLIILIIFRTKA
jgi:hypothetical protein